MEHPGHVHAGRPDSHWNGAVCVVSGDEVVLKVGGTEVLRVDRSVGDFVESGPNVFSVVGADETVHFSPINRLAFERDLRGESTAADRIAIAAEQQATPAHPAVSVAVTQPTPAYPAVAVVVPRPPAKSRVTAGVLALLLGFLGVHKFYLGQIGLGVLYLIFAWTFIPALIAFIEGILYLVMSDEEFARKHG